MNDLCAPPLRVLLANERSEHLEQIADVITRLGHVVTAHETDIAAVAARTEVGIFDVAIVGVGEGTEHALDLIGRIVREANCPVITILNSEDAAFIHQAAKRGVFAYITASQTSEEQLASAIDVVLARFAEFHNLGGHGTAAAETAFVWAIVRKPGEILAVRADRVRDPQRRIPPPRGIWGRPRALARARSGRDARTGTRTAGSPTT
jgi:AmiR/NasT family two-component response regulator